MAPLGPDELAALVALLPLVHAEFALSELEYFHGVVRSSSSADAGLCLLRRPHRMVSGHGRSGLSLGHPGHLRRADPVISRTEPRGASGPVGVTPGGPLIDARTLAGKIFAGTGSTSPVVLDATVVLPAPRFDGDHSASSGLPRFLGGHVPGARHADLLDGLSDRTKGFHFALPEPDQLVGALRGLGVADGPEVVVYDSAGGLWAARLWWMLRSSSISAAVLDGGLDVW